MVLLSQNDIPRLKELVSVALKHKRSVNYIVDKVLDAIDGIYHAQPSSDDKDLAFIVLKLGPSLLSVHCKANKLPSCSTAYRMAKELKSLVCPISISAGECVKNNLDLPYFHNSYASTLKMDETFLTPRLRYNGKSAFNLQFNNFSDLEISQTIAPKIYFPQKGPSHKHCKGAFSLEIGIF